MTAKFTVDTAAKLFIIKTGVTAIDVKHEFYSDIKEEWMSTHMQYRFPIDSIAGNALGGGVAISPYFSLKHGWKIRPPEENTQITLTGNIITSDASSPYVGTVGTFDTVLTAVVSGNSLTQSVGGVSPTEAEIWDDPIVESGSVVLSPREALRVALAVLAGDTDNAETGTIDFKQVGGLKVRVQSDQDGVGNRDNVVIDASD